MNPKAKTIYDQVKDWGEKPAPWVVAGGILVLAFLLFIIGLLASDTYDTVYHDYATSKAQADAQNVFDRECAKICSEANGLPGLVASTRHNSYRDCIGSRNRYRHFLSS